MNIKVISLKRIYKVFSFAKWIAFVSVVLIGSLLIAEGRFYSDEYMSAMQALSEREIIIIDAGHGGEDPGTIGVNGRYEKDLNLEVALMLGEMLSEKGYAVIYTRTEDKLLYTEEENIKGIRKICDLKNRCKIAAEYPSAIFLSIHMNYYKNSKFDGLQVYYSTENQDSRILADKIQNSVKNNLQHENNRTVKRGDNIYLLENTDNPSVLIECGFISNEEECKKLSEKEYQKQLCSALICAIIEYKEVKN